MYDVNRSRTARTIYVWVNPIETHVINSRFVNIFLYKHIVLAITVSGRYISGYMLVKYTLMVDKNIMAIAIKWQPFAYLAQSTHTVLLHATTELYVDNSDDFTFRFMLDLECEFDISLYHLLPSLGNEIVGNRSVNWVFDWGMWYRFELRDGRVLFICWFLGK